MSHAAPAVLGDLVVPVRTWSPARDAPNGSFKYIDLSALDQDAKVITGSREVPCADAPSRARQLVVAGDVLVSTVRPNLNGVARVPSEMDGATASTGFCVLRPHPKRLDGAYLLHWVRSPQFIAQMVKRATGASYPAVSDRIVLDSTIPLPALPEQRRIAQLLERAEALRTRRRIALTQIHTLSQSIFVDMMGDPESNSMGWPLRALPEVASITYGYPFDSALFASEGERPVVRIRDVLRGRSDTYWTGADEYEARHIVRDGEILVGMDGEFNCARWNGGAALLNQRVCRINAIEGELDDAYLFALLPTVLKRIERATPFVTVKHLSAKQLNATQLPVPPSSLQAEFSKRTALLESVAFDQNASLTQFSELCASIQRRAFSGEL